MIGVGGDLHGGNVVELEHLNEEGMYGHGPSKFEVRCMDDSLKGCSGGFHHDKHVAPLIG